MVSSSSSSSPEAADSTAAHTFPKAAQKGSHYAPLPDKSKDGHVTSHAVQTILVEPQALYELWNDVESIPLWQEHVVSVTKTGASSSHWVMGNPEDADGKRIEFDSEETENEPGKKIAWHSVTPGVEQSGVVTFEPHYAGRGTTVTLVQDVKIPGGVLGAFAGAVAERGPEQTVIEDLRHFKQLAESGEIPTVEGQPHGPRGTVGKIKRWMYGETNPTPTGTQGEA